VADFIVDHGVIMDEKVNLVETRPWLLFFMGRCVVKGRGSAVKYCRRLGKVTSWISC
jgi:hypothetical protein